MIAKRVARTTKDRFGRLANYIANAEDPGEKLDDFWMVNCEDMTELSELEVAIDVIEETQKRSKSKQDLTYHLMVSFRDEKPTPEALREIEAAYAKALGYEDHQRVIGTHVNTDNFHMHIAYSKVHPENFRTRTPSYDFSKLEKVSRAMELKYGLKIDRGKEDTKAMAMDNNPLPPKVRDQEAKTWEQSFDSYVLQKKPELQKILEKSKNWKELNQGFAKQGLLFKLKGNGLVITEPGSRKGMKASTLGREFSKPALEAQFGPFVGADLKQIKTAAKSRVKFKRKPLTRHNGQSRLWNAFQKGRRPKNSLSRKPITSWRDYVETAVEINDELALEIMNAKRKAGTEFKKMFSEFKQDANRMKALKAAAARKLAAAQKSAAVKKAKQDKAAGISVGKWQSAKEWATKKNSVFLAENQINGYAVKIDNAGSLIIPARDLEGKIHSLMTINQTTRKMETNGLREGVFHLLDKDKTLSPDTSRVIITETYESAAALHEATKEPVLVAFNSNNLKAVAENVRAKFPEAQIVLGSDSPDHSLNDKQMGVSSLDKAMEAARAVNGSVMAPPEFSGSEELGVKNWHSFAQNFDKKGVQTLIREELESAWPVAGPVNEKELEQGQDMAPVKPAQQRANDPADRSRPHRKKDKEQDMGM